MPAAAKVETDHPIIILHSKKYQSSGLFECQKRKYAPNRLSIDSEVADKKSERPKETMDLSDGSIRSGISTDTGQQRIHASAKIIMAGTQRQAETKPSALRSTWVFNLLIASVALATGIATPWFLNSRMVAETVFGRPVNYDSEYAYLDFGTLVVNLDEPNLTRYLKVHVSLAVTPTQHSVLERQVKARKALLTDWLNGYLSSQTMDSIRGRTGQNRLRREIREQFNRILSSRIDKPIEGVLFLEFNVQ